MSADLHGVGQVRHEAMTEYTDMLLFRHAHNQAAGQHTFRWMGNWPPPDDLVIVREKPTSQIKVINPLEQAEGTLEVLSRDPNLEIFWFRLNSASERPERAPKDANWFRGAEYIVVRGG